MTRHVEAEDTQQSLVTDQEERRFAGSTRACLKRRRANFSFSFQPKVFTLHKLKVANKRNIMIELEFLIIA